MTAQEYLFAVASAFVRTTALATAMSLSIIAVATAADVGALVRKTLEIPPQQLGPALSSLASDFDLQVLYRTEIVGGLQTRGASGSMTATEALERVLSGTGLTYRYLDSETVAILPAENGAKPNAGGDASRDTKSSRPAARADSAERIHMADAHAGADSGPAQARSPDSRTGEVGEVVVTGSRIGGQTSLTSASLVSIATHEDIVLSKSTSVEDVLGRVPGVDFNGGESSSNNNASGQSLVGLRNLGPPRTLVLLDGRRLISQFGGSTNLNIVPLAMVDHIEVLKDGASSIYGADAIGGVINLITKKHEEGIGFNASYGVSGAGDAQTKAVSITLGANVGEGNILVGLAWNRRDPLPLVNRDWATATHADDPRYPGGSGYRSTLDLLSNQNDPSQVWAGAASSSEVRSARDPSLASLAPQLVYISGWNRVQFRSGGWSYLTTGLDQRQINLAGRLPVGESVSVVADGFFTKYVDNFRLGPDALPGTIITTPRFAGFIIPSTNPYNVSGSDITATLIPVQLGPRDFTVDSDVYRMRFGFEGTLAGRFSWQIGYVRQDNTASFNVANQINYDHIQQLTGQIACVNVPGGCTNGLPTVPVNFFNAPNIFTQEQIDYLTFDNTSISHDSQNYAYGDITATVFDLPAGPLKAAAGFESRQEHYDNTPHELVQDGLGGGGISLPTRGGYGVKAVYGELQVPVLRGLPFARALNLSPSVRYDDYSTFGGKTTFKVGLDYEASSDIRFRGAYSTAIRAPRVAELFSGSTLSAPTGGGDPCETNPAYSANRNFGKGVLTAGSTCSLAVAGGGPVTSFTSLFDINPNSQIQQLQGGNANLRPESAHTISAGFVLTPRVAPGLTFTADYYDVALSDTILTSGIGGSAGIDFILNRCYGPAQDTSYCAYVVRDANGGIVRIDSLATNVGTSVVRGVDYELAYNTRGAGLDLPYIGGVFNFDLQATQQLQSRQTNPDGTVVDFNGFFNVSNNTYQPKWKGIVTLDYLRNAWKLRYNARASSSTRNIDRSLPVDGNYLPSVVYHDFSASYDAPALLGLAPVRLIVGVNNVLDKSPAFIGSEGACRCNALPGPFDFTGRFFYTSVSMHF